MASYTPNLNLIKPADVDSYDVANDNGNMDKIDAAYASLNSNINPYGTKYIRGKFDVSSGSPTTVLGKIQAFISGVTTDNKEVDFDVMLSYQGTHYFIGHLYPGKDWGHGFYIAIDGRAYKWTRLNSVDSIEEFASTSYQTIEYNIKVSKNSGVVTVSFEYFNDTTELIPANTDFATVPVGFRPSFKVSFVEPFNSKRIFVNEDGGIFSTTDIPSGSKIRGYISYVC